MIISFFDSLFITLVFDSSDKLDKNFAISFELDKNPVADAYAYVFEWVNISRWSFPGIIRSYPLLKLDGISSGRSGKVCSIPKGFSICFDI